MKKVIRVLNIKLPSNYILPVCESCCVCKIHRLPFPSSSNPARRATCVGFCIHMDVCGPFPVIFGSNYKYILVILDEYSRYAQACIIENKSATVVLSCFIKYHNLLINNNINIIHIRTDGGGEFINQHMTDYCARYGIEHDVTNPYSPQQNGVAERYNRTLIYTLNTIRFDAGLPDYYWAVAARAACFVLNRLPHSFLSYKTPYSMFYNREPDLRDLHPFGCLAYVRNNIPYVPKLGVRGEPCVFIGYEYTRKGYIFISLATDRTVRSRDALFQDHIFPYKLYKHGHNVYDLQVGEGLESVAVPEITDRLDYDRSIPISTTTISISSNGYSDNSSSSSYTDSSNSTASASRGLEQSSVRPPVEVTRTAAAGRYSAIGNINEENKRTYDNFSSGVCSDCSVFNRDRGPSTPGMSLHPSASGLPPMSRVVLCNDLDIPMLSECPVSSVSSEPVSGSFSCFA